MMRYRSRNVRRELFERFLDTARRSFQRLAGRFLVTQGVVDFLAQDFFNPRVLRDFRSLPCVQKVSFGKLIDESHNRRTRRCLGIGADRGGRPQG